jgi:hypothetical protein
MEMNIPGNGHLLSLMMIYFVGFRNGTIANKDTRHSLLVKLVPLDLWNMNKTLPKILRKLSEGL